MIRIFLAAVAYTMIFFAPLANTYGQWTQSVGGGGVNCFIDSGSHLYAGTSNGLTVSTDHGESWQTLIDWGYNGGTPQVGAVAVLGANIFVSVLSEYLLSDQGHGIIRSSDGGFNWFPANGGLGDSTITSFAVIGNNIFAATEFEGVFRSSDSGNKWFAINKGLPYGGSPPDGYINRLLASGNNLYATTDSGLFISNDLGQNWSSLGGRTTGAVTEIAVSGSNLISTSDYALRQNGFFGANMFLSTDAGTRWSIVDDTVGLGVEISVFNSYYDLSSLFFYENNLFASISGSQDFPAVTFSTDLGTSWTVLDSGTPDRINSAIVSGPNLVIGGTFGIWYRHLSDFGIDVVQSSLKYKSSFKIFSNPIISSADFQFDALKAPSVFELFDALGRSVLRRELSAGQASLHLDMQKYPAGMYFARLGGETVRFIKLKA